MCVWTSSERKQPCALKEKVCHLVYFPLVGGLFQSMMITEKYCGVHVSQWTGPQIQRGTTRPLEQHYFFLRGRGAEVTACVSVMAHWWFPRMFVQILALLIHKSTLHPFPPPLSLSVLMRSDVGRRRGHSDADLALLCAIFDLWCFCVWTFIHFSPECQLSHCSLRLICDVYPLRPNNIWTGVLSYTLTSRPPVYYFTAVS